MPPSISLAPILCSLRTTKAAKPTKPKPVIKAVQPKGKYLTKSELMNNFCAESGLDKKMARTCFESLTTIGQGELAKGRKFVIPGMARFVVKKKAATKAREGTFFIVTF